MKGNKKSGNVFPLCCCTFTGDILCTVLIYIPKAFLNDCYIVKGANMY